MNQNLQDIQRNQLLGGLSLKEYWDCFADKINNSIRKHVPVSKTNSDTSKVRPPMNRQCATAMKNKHRKWMRFNTTELIQTSNCIKKQEIRFP